MNIEGQNLSSSYRKIRTRMLRYPCRLVADQKERQVPTVSLWLCFGFPRKYQGKEASYVLEDVPLGVGLGGFFAVLLSSELATRQKVEMLRAWGFTMTEQMQKEDKDMHSWEGKRESRKLPSCMCETLPRSRESPMTRRWTSWTSPRQAGRESTGRSPSIGEKSNPAQTPLPCNLS